MRASRILSTLFLSSLFIAGCGDDGDGGGDDVADGGDVDDDDDTDDDTSDDDTGDDTPDDDTPDDDTPDDDTPDDDTPDDDTPDETDGGIDAGPGTDEDGGVDGGPVDPVEMDGGTACDAARNTCDENATCTNPGDGGLTPICECNAPYLGTGDDCTLPLDCQEVQELLPDAASGVYTLGTGSSDADSGAPGTIEAYCDMDTAGGGWTEAVSGDSSFDPEDVAAAGPGYTLPISEGSLIIDFSSTPIEPGEYEVRVVISPTDDDSAGATVMELLTEDNFINFDLNENNRSNQELHFNVAAGDAGADGGSSTADCATATAAWPALSAALCEGGGAHLVIQDQGVGAACNGENFIIGTSGGGNCTGWPQSTGGDYPEYVRIWVR